MADKMKAIILAVRDKTSSPLWPYSSVTGFHAIEHEALIETLQDAGLWLGPRGQLEVNAAFRQIIPYIIIRQNGRYLTYLRGAAGGEDRLHGKLSIGVGGHVDIGDVDIGDDDASIDLAGTIDNATVREVSEEIEVWGTGPMWTPAPNVVGLIVDNSDDVGKVHIGVAGIVDLPDGYEARPAEDSQQDLQFLSAEELLAQADRLEGWTRIFLEGQQTA